MLCYKDRTFCPFEQCKKFPVCPTALTEKVQADAIRWWGKEGAPIAQFASKPSCFESK